MGLGVFKEWNNSGYYDGDDWGVYDYKANGLAFAIKPNLHFDWFLSRHAFLGFGFELPLLIIQEKVGIWFSTQLHFGYKF